ncbi:MAG TPA: signal recognition particle protein [Candidatus Sumerlaeota bacterium]|nr:signal recognition particle protein [Candidatus Sumerlaeota bacterium]
MFDNLGKKLQDVVRNMSGQGTITEKNIQDALREVRLALLEADVHFKVVKDFISRAREQALGQEVLRGINPGQQFIKIVHDQLVETMGERVAPFELDKSGLNVVMLLGLQGSGKTTFSAKLAKRLAKEGWKPLLVACDIYRPAAIKQLHTVGAQVGVSVFDMGTETPVVTIAQEAIAKAKREGHNVVILDTAGRLHIDEMKMDELVGLRDAVKPRFTFLVSDAMTGQDAVNSAGQFHTHVGIDGVCLTKLDGDARGGAALSIRAVTGRPIFFAGMGEQLDDLELFHPDRMAQRILGMGDVLTLVEKAQEAFDQEDAEELRRKIRKEAFTFNDFLKQMKQVKKMGSLSKIMKFIPGMSQVMDQIDEGEMEKEMRHTEAIIHSMTIEERENPSILTASRRARIGKGCGLGVAAVNNLIKEFEMARKMMKHLVGGPKGPMPPGGGLPGAAGGRGPLGLGHGAGKSQSKSEMRKKKKQSKQMRKKSR